MTEKFIVLGKDYDYDWTILEERPDFPVIQEIVYEHDTRNVQLMQQESFQHVTGTRYRKIIESKRSVAWEDWCAVGINHVQRQVDAEHWVYERDIPRNVWTISFTHWGDFLEFCVNNQAMLISTYFVSQEGETMRGLVL